MRGRFKRAVKALLGKPVYFSDVYLAVGAGYGDVGKIRSYKLRMRLVMLAPIVLGIYIPT